MNILSLAWNYLKAKSLNTILNMLLLGLGIAVITVLLLFNKQFQQKINDNSRGVDLVVGAKGSPLQLILCNIFHIDFPTGNISLRDAEKIARHRLVKSTIPLALGDSYKGYRIIGTSSEFVGLYDATLATGKIWIAPMEVAIGSNVATSLGLNVNDKFASTHGLSVEGHAHEENDFIVAGIFNKTNTVLDNLIITSIESVWQVHETHTEEHHEHRVIQNPSPLVKGAEAGDSTREVTSLLIEYRNPIAAIQLPRWVNSQSALQAASPAFETARLFTILGVGVDVLEVFAMILVVISALSIFIALYNSLKERRYDLAIMRAMGATRNTLVATVLLEGIVLTFFGTLLGLLMGHLTLSGLGTFVEETRKAGITGMIFFTEEWIILVGSLLLGLLCALIPAVQAYRTDISKVLAGNA